MKSTPVRVPEEVYDRLRTLSGLLGQTPGDILQQAFFEYVDAHRAEIREIFDHAKKFVASQDLKGLTSLAAQGRAQRAKRAAIAARRMD